MHARGEASFNRAGPGRITAAYKLRACWVRTRNLTAVRMGRHPSERSRISLSPYIPLSADTGPRAPASPIARPITFWYAQQRPGALSPITGIDLLSSSALPPTALQVMAAGEAWTLVRQSIDDPRQSNLAIDVQHCMIPGLSTFGSEKVS